MLIILLFVSLFLAISNDANFNAKMRKVKYDSLYSLQQGIREYYERSFPTARLAAVNQKFKELPYIDETTKIQLIKKKNKILFDWYEKEHIPNHIRQYFYKNNCYSPRNKFLNDIVNREVKKIEDMRSQNYPASNLPIPKSSVVYSIICQKYKRIILSMAVPFSLLAVFVLLSLFILIVGQESIDPYSVEILAICMGVAFSALEILFLIYSIMHICVANEIKDVWYNKWDEDYKPRVSILIPFKTVVKRLVKTQNKKAALEFMLYLTGTILAAVGGFLLGIAFEENEPSASLVMGLLLVVIGGGIWLTCGILLIIRYAKAFKEVRAQLNKNPDEAAKLVRNGCRIYMNDYLEDCYKAILEKSDKNIDSTKAPENVLIGDTKDLDDADEELYACTTSPPSDDINHNETDAT